MELNCRKSHDLFGEQITQLPFRASNNGAPLIIFKKLKPHENEERHDDSVEYTIGRKPGTLDRALYVLPIPLGTTSPKTNNY